MKAVDVTFVTDHVLIRYRWHTGNQDAVSEDVMAVLEGAKQVTKKSTEWYAPLVRNTVVPGKAYFYNEEKDLVLVCEHDETTLRIMTVYPLPSVVCSNMGIGKMTAIANDRKLGIVRDRRVLDQRFKRGRRKAHA